MEENYGDFIYWVLRFCEYGTYFQRGMSNVQWKCRPVEYGQYLFFRLQRAGRRLLCLRNLWTAKDKCPHIGIANVREFFLFGILSDVCRQQFLVKIVVPQ